MIVPNDIKNNKKTLYVRQGGLKSKIAQRYIVYQSNAIKLV